MARFYLDEFAPKAVGSIDLSRRFELVTDGFTRWRLRDAIVQLTDEAYTVPDVTGETVVKP